MSSTPLQVAVISPRPLIRAGLTAVIRKDPARAVVVDPRGCGGRPGHQDVVVYDGAGRTGHDRCQTLLRLAASGVPVVVLAGRDGAVLSATALGAREVVSEAVCREELLAALER